MSAHPRHLLALIAEIQGILVGCFILSVILNRWYQRRRRRRAEPLQTALDDAMQRWSAAAAGPALSEVLRRLAAAPAGMAIDALVSWSARVGGDRWQPLAVALAGERWARRVRRNYRSWRWWKRLECARLLSVAGLPTDTKRLLGLLADRHPAVHIAAVASLERLESPPLIAAALEGLRTSPPTVQGYYAGMLRHGRPLVVQALLRHLAASHKTGLGGLAEFAVRLKDPALREPLTALATHADPDVRAQAARGLGFFPHAQSVAALRALAQDHAWPVRAQAARSLGMIADPSTLPVLRPLLQDVAWWVRLRAALALTRFGATGKAALVEVQAQKATAARAVADLVLGLSPQAIAEYSA